MAQAAPEYRDARVRDGITTSEEPAVRSTTEARQGVTGHNVRYVLVFGLGGVVLAFALIYAVFWA